MEYFWKTLRRCLLKTEISNKGYGIQNRGHSVITPVCQVSSGCPLTTDWLSALLCPAFCALEGWPVRTACPVLPYPMAFHWEWQRKAVLLKMGVRERYKNSFPTILCCSRRAVLLHGHSYCWVVSSTVLDLQVSLCWLSLLLQTLW